jgi:hypothetical protein
MIAYGVVVAAFALGRPARLRRYGKPASCSPFRKDGCSLAQRWPPGVFCVVVSAGAVLLGL